MAAITEADGVFQGGGVKGIALAGALLAFADGHRPQDLEGLMRGVPYASFQDWGPGGKIAGGAWNLARHHGLAHGEAFRAWLDRELDGATFASVRRDDDAPDKGGDPYRLRLIASDVTQHRMLVLPADLSGYRLPGVGQPIDLDAFKIADAVRMSMSIPFFFQPVLLESGPDGRDVHDRRRRHPLQLPRVAVRRRQGRHACSGASSWSEAGASVSGRLRSRGRRGREQRAPRASRRAADAHVRLSS